MDCFKTKLFPLSRGAPSATRPTLRNALNRMYTGVFKVNKHKMNCMHIQGTNSVSPLKVGEKWGKMFRKCSPQLTPVCMWIRWSDGTVTHDKYQK